ncbi:MAG: hypothetical protein JO021_18390, partial [Alphaproteobacteria bacterium]|nr:hypothetical protein [Alphaproteobacteria bacterium]
TSAAKLDRRALPPPGRRAAGEGGPPPRTPLEQLLAAIWAEVLGGELEVGRDDDFFALGGHSLLATQAVSRIRQACAVELPLREIYDTPVLAALAERIERLRAGERGSLVVMTEK